MQLRFVPPDLRRLDEAGGEIVACAVFADERPPRGLAGLVDWRLAGRIGRFLGRGWLTGAAGEVAMIPVRPRLPFDKALLLGAGEAAAFDEASFVALVARLLDTLEALCVRRAVVELPGRGIDLVSPERAADLLLAAAGGRSAHDEWTLVEPAEAQRRIGAHMVEQRRRVRREAP